jgi:hypothetical protein
VALDLDPVSSGNPVGVPIDAGLAQQIKDPSFSFSDGFDPTFRAQFPDSPAAKQKGLQDHQNGPGGLSKVLHKGASAVATRW